MTGRRAVTESGITSLIHRVAGDKAGESATHDQQDACATLDRHVVWVQWTAHDDDGDEDADEGSDRRGRCETLDKGDSTNLRS